MVEESENNVKFWIKKMNKLTCLYMLPNVRLWIYDAHIWLVCSTVYKRTVVHLEEGMTSIVLITFNNLLYNREELRTGECWHVVALFAKGRINIWPSHSVKSVFNVDTHRGQRLTVWA